MEEKPSLPPIPHPPNTPPHPPYPKYPRGWGGGGENAQNTSPDIQNTSPDTPKSWGVFFSEIKSPCGMTTWPRHTWKEIIREIYQLYRNHEKRDNRQKVEFDL